MGEIANVLEVHLISLIFILVAFIFVIVNLLQIASVKIKGNMWIGLIENLYKMNNLLDEPKNYKIKNDMSYSWRNNWFEQHEKYKKLNEEIFNNSTNEEIIKLYKTNLAIIKINREKNIISAYLDRKEFTNEVICHPPIDYDEKKKDVDNGIKPIIIVLLIFVLVTFFNMKI